MPLVDPLFFLERSFVFVYIFDKDCYRYYDQNLLKDYPNLDKIMRSYITSNYEMLSESFSYEDCNYDNSSYISGLQSCISTLNIEIPDDFIRRIRSMGLRFSAGNVSYIVSSPDSFAFKEVKLLADNIDIVVDNINIEDPYSLDTIIEILNTFGGSESTVEKVKSCAYLFKDLALKPKRYMSLYKKNPMLFDYICKSIIKDNNVEDASKFPELLKSMYKNNDFTERVAASAESIWAYFNFDEYKKIRFSKVKSFDYRKRAIVYSAIILSGRANRSIARAIRSDGSKFTSYFCAQCLIKSRDMYSKNEWQGMLSQMCDSRYIEVIRILERGVPKEVLPFLVGNTLSNKTLIAKRMSE